MGIKTWLPVAHTYLGPNPLAFDTCNGAVCQRAMFGGSGKDSWCVITLYLHIILHSIQDYLKSLLE